MAIDVALMGSISRIIAELYKMSILFRRNYFRLFDVTVWPFILFFSVVLFLKFMSPSQQIMSMVITGLIGWRAVYHLQIEPNITYMEDYWSKNTCHILASPIKIMDTIIAGIISGIVKFSIVLCMYLIFAYSLFSFRIFDPFKFIVGILFLCFSGFVFGMITYGLTILYKDKAITFSFMIPDLIVLMSGVYYPISIFPEIIVKFVHVLPTFYGFELLKSMSGLGSADYIGMIISGALWLIGAIAFLRFCIKKARKNGSFSNFN